MISVHRTSVVRVSVSDDGLISGKNVAFYDVAAVDACGFPLGNNSFRWLLFVTVAPHNAILTSRSTCAL